MLLLNLMVLVNLRMEKNSTFNNVKIELEIPASLLPYVNHNEFKSKQIALLLYPYIANGDISNGKAAEILGISKTTLLDMFGEMGIPYYQQSIEDLEQDIANLNLLNKVQ